jgi:periplasmic protein TonB
VRPSVASSGGGSGTGPALGSGAGGGTGGQGHGTGEGGTDSELIAGGILPSDYPQHLANAGNRRVTVTFSVQVNGRAAGCRATRSSGIPELADLTQDWIAPRVR